MGCAVAGAWGYEIAGLGLGRLTTTARAHNHERHLLLIRGILHHPLSLKTATVVRAVSDWALCGGVSHHLPDGRVGGDFTGGYGGFLIVAGSAAGVASLFPQRKLPTSRCCLPTPAPFCRQHIGPVSCQQTVDRASCRTCRSSGGWAGTCR